MRKQVDNSVASRLVNCGMVVLISSTYKDRNNITTCAWHMPVSKEPPLIAVALAKGHFSSFLIKHSKEFVVNIPVWEQIDKVILCGRLKGKEVDKFKETDFTPSLSCGLKKAVSISECVASLECALVDIKESGDHFIFIGKIVYAEAEEKYFYNNVWDTKKVEFIFHLGGRNFFKSSSLIEMDNG